MDETALYRLCDYILRETNEPIAAFFLSDGTVRIGLGRAREKTKTSFCAIPFDENSAKKKQFQFWENSTEQIFFPQHLISGNLRETISMQSEDIDSLHRLVAAASVSLVRKEGPVRWKTEEVREDWNTLCAVAKEEIDCGRLEKLVPARYLHLMGRKNVWKNYFTRLRETSSENTHRFLWRMNGQIFFGASPELLFRFDGGKLFVPAIAGTRSYKENSESASRELLSSEKEAREHAVVVRDILKTLAELGLSATAPESPEVMVLKNLVHLFTPIEARMSPGISLLNIGKKLHPTPAMGGFPRLESARILAENETWDRGFYSSPLGFIDEDGTGAFVVGIRSALFSKERVTLFAGAGYVRGSSAETEWNETRSKMQGMLGVFGI